MMRSPLHVLVVAGLFACSPESAPLVASDVVITRPLPGTQMSAGYLVLSNSSDQPITITRVTSPDFASITLHESIIQDDISRMLALNAVTIPAHGKIEFKRGARHLMLLRPLGTGATATLQFYADDVPVLTVKAVIEE